MLKAQNILGRSINFDQLGKVFLSSQWFLAWAPCEGDNNYVGASMRDTAKQEEFNGFDNFCTLVVYTY
jgi:hypothetical protein